MTLTVTRTFTDPPHFAPPSNCYFHNSATCCLANGVYRWLRWEGQKLVSSNPDLIDSQSRIFGSTDDGATWSLLTEFDIPVKTQWDGLFSPNGTRLLTRMRDKGGYAYDAAFSGLARSEDGGLTWSSAVSQALFDSIITPGILAFDTTAIVKLPGTTTVLAFGRYDVPGGPYNVLRSTDTGVTFTPLAAVGPFGFIVNYAAALTATTVVAMDASNGYYSTDAGATWTVATEPGVATTLFEPTSLGGGVVLAVGRNASAVGAIFHSTDSGQNYTQLALLPNASMVQEGRLHALSPTRVVAGGRDSTAPNGLVTWWLSEDAGTTWTEATLSGTRVALSLTSGFTVTNTGIVLTDMDDPQNSTHVAAIWRGVVDGFSTTVGTCESLDSLEPGGPGIAVMGVHLECIPVFSPTPCPPVCPDDPPQPAGVLVIPDGGGMPIIPVALSMRLACTPTFSMGLCAPRYPTDPVQPAGQFILPGGGGPVLPGGGWRSVMTLLGLVNAPAIIPGPTGALGQPATCGATFANNNCAVAGC